jgi:hypothetical protein
LSGNAALVRVLLAAGSDPASVDPAGRTALEATLQLQRPVPTAPRYDEWKPLVWLARKEEVVRVLRAAAPLPPALVVLPSESGQKRRRHATK